MSSEYYLRLKEMYLPHVEKCLIALVFCVHKSSRVHARTDACARRRRIAESSRTVKQAQAAGRAGEAAKEYSSRY